MCWWTSIVAAVLFVICSPNIVFQTLSKKRNKYAVAFVHAILFSALLTLYSMCFPLYEGARSSSPKTRNGTTLVFEIILTVAVVIIGLILMAISMFLDAVSSLFDYVTGRDADK